MVRVELRGGGYCFFNLFDIIIIEIKEYIVVRGERDDSYCYIRLYNKNREPMELYIKKGTLAVMTAKEYENCLFSLVNEVVNN